MVPVVTADKVVIVAPDRVTTALNRRDGSQVWREKNDNKVRESLGRSSDGRVAYAKTMDGTLVAMSTGDNYQELWKGDLAEFLMSSRGRFINGADILIDGGCTASYWYGDLQYLKTTH